MTPRHRHPRFHALWALGMALLLGSRAWAAPSLIELPPGESASDWEGALGRHGLGTGPGGIQIAVAGDGWHLAVHTDEGAREAVVPAPTSAAGREVVAALAAALLAPSPSLPQLYPSAAPTVPIRPTAPSPARPPTARTTVPTPKVPTPRAQPAPLAAAPTPVAPLPDPAPLAAAPTPVAPLPDPAPLAATPTPVAPLPDPAPLAAAPMPVAPLPPPERAAAPASAVHPSLSLAARGTSRIHPGLGTTFGGGGALRLGLGRVWVAVGAVTTAEAPLADGLGGLGASRLGGQIGLAALTTRRLRLDLGVGAGAQAWRVQDLDGERTSWAADAEVSAALAVSVWGPLAVEVGAAGIYDFQQIEVLGSAEAPAPVVVEPFLGIRLSP